MPTTKPAPPTKKMVVLEEATLISMANQPQFVKQFKFLKDLKNLARSSTRGGGCCGSRKRDDGRTVKVQQAKQNIAGMGDDRKRMLRKMLNTRKVRVSYKQGSKIVQHTF